MWKIWFPQCHQKSPFFQIAAIGSILMLKFSYFFNKNEFVILKLAKHYKMILNTYFYHFAMIKNYKITVASEKTSMALFVFAEIKKILDLGIQLLVIKSQITRSVLIILFCLRLSTMKYSCPFKK